MDPILITQKCWIIGFAIASLQFFAVSMECYVRLVFAAFKRREFVPATILAVLLVLAGGGWVIGTVVGMCIGWRYARHWQVRGLMAIWSISLILGIVNIALGAWIREMSDEQLKMLPAF